MVTASNRVPESPEAEETANGFLRRMLHFERPSVTVNQSLTPNVIDLATRREALDTTRVEGGWLQRNVGDLFLSRTETRSELYTHSANVNGDLTVVSANVQDLAETWHDDPALKRQIDQYERYNRQYGNQAGLLIETQLREQRAETEARQRETGERVEANDNRAPEDPEESRLREEAVARWEQFAVQDESGRWRSRRLSEAVLSWDNIKERWQNRSSFFGFFTSLGADYAQWRAVKETVPAVNVVSYGVREGRETLERYREIGETVAEGAELVGAARSTQREVRREGAEAVVLTSAAARSDYVRNLIGRLMRGEVSREQLLTTSRTAFSRFQQQDPEEFARMIRSHGLTARSLNTRAGFYELFKNTALWYTPWADRGERSFWEANETAVPIWGSYAAWRDINIDNGLPLWSRIGFASAGTALDIGTVLSLGTLTPAIIAGRAALMRGSQAIATRVAQRGVVGAGAQTGARTLGQLLASLPRAARNAVTNTGARGLAIGAAGYTALSAGLDWLFDLEDRAVDLAFVAAETALGQEFSYQQRRLLRVVGQDVEPVIREAYADYREGNAPSEGEDAIIAANENEGPAPTENADSADQTTLSNERVAS